LNVFFISIHLDWLSFASNKVTPKETIVTVMKKKTASSSGSLPMNKPVDLSRVDLHHFPDVIASESAKDR